jgi:hypothetical protein
MSFTELDKCALHTPPKPPDSQPEGRPPPHLRSSSRTDRPQPRPLDLRQHGLQPKGPHCQPRSRHPRIHRRPRQHWGPSRARAGIHRCDTRPRQCRCRRCNSRSRRCARLRRAGGKDGGAGGVATRHAARHLRSQDGGGRWPMGHQRRRHQRIAARGKRDGREKCCTGGGGLPLAESALSLAEVVLLLPPR